MRAHATSARGLLVALVLCICACAPSPRPLAPVPATPDAAIAALRVGDLDALRTEFGKADGLAEHATELQQRLDPEAWRVAMGAVTRQFDMPAAAAAMQARDAAALRDALGFSDQTLTTDVLNATASVTQKRAGDQNYYDQGAAPADAFSGWQIPALPTGADAYHVTVLLREGEATVQLHFGRDHRGLTDMRAAIDIAGRAPFGPAIARATRVAELMPAPMRVLDTSWLDEPRFTGASLQLLLEGGTLCSIRMEKTDGQWVCSRRQVTSLSQRLADTRDARLIGIQRAASDYAARHARWPAPDTPLALKAADWVDTAVPESRLGWAEYDAIPPRGFELLQAAGPLDVAVLALRQEEQGRRAINRRGDLSWVP